LCDKQWRRDLLTIKGYNVTNQSLVKVNVVNLQNGMSVSGTTRPTNSSGALVWFDADIVTGGSCGVPLSVTVRDMMSLYRITTVVRACDF